MLRGRQLSACEEESEIESSTVDINRSQSPLHSPRSRRLLSARSSPNLTKSISRSDLSGEEEDDDIINLPYMRPRQSPFTSPHLSSRQSPTHNCGYSSDEDASTTDLRRRRSGKRLRYKKSLHPLVRVDSASSDDSALNDRQMRHSLPKFGKEKLRKMIPYRSVPSTPAEGSGSETFLDMVRRPRSYSARTDSSLSDANDIAQQMSEKFELSDGEEMDAAEVHGATIVGGGPNRLRANSFTQSAVCCIL